ncbi:putative barnase/colicin E5 family endoribonuclease, partial [Helicobacter salomonis]
ELLGKEQQSSAAIKENLNPQEIKETIEKWDLSPKANANAKQRLVVSSVDATEAQELGQALKFKGKRELVREIDAHQVLHTLKQHGDAIKEAKRGQIAVTLEDIAHYQEYLKNPDFKHIQEESGRIVYAKQINGYAVVIEEALSGQDKLRFFDMWKLKGQLNKEVLLSHSQRPNTTPSLDLEGYMPSSVSKHTKPPLKTPHIEPNPAFGEHFAEFEGKGKEAVAKLLKEQRGQVAGAFYREGLGYIDLVWGNVEGKGNKATGWGLSKILEKHIDDFKGFEGNNALEKLGNGINEIVQRGEVVVQEKKRTTIIYSKDGRLFRVGLKQNWKGEPTENKWIITAYEDVGKP